MGGYTYIMEHWIEFCNGLSMCVCLQIVQIIFKDILNVILAYTNVIIEELYSLFFTLKIIYFFLILMAKSTRKF